MIREAILHFDPLQTQVKTEIIDQNGLHRVKFIENDELMHAIRQNSYAPPQHSGLLPPNCIALTEHKEQWTVTLASDFDHCEVSYYNTRYDDFPVPRILLSCTLHGDRLQNFRLAIADQGELTPQTALFKCPFPNVNDFSLCVGSNVIAGYDSIWKLRTLLHRIMAVPFGDDYYRAEQTRLNLSARELFEHLKDKTPDYYYSHVLIPSGKTLSDFIGGKL